MAQECSYRFFSNDNLYNVGFIMKIQKLEVFLADRNIQKKSFAKFMGVKPSQVSYWIKNDFQVMFDAFDYCHLVKTYRRFDAGEL